ncbi:MAG: hypothetical protein DRQ88_01640 [Epsilonproteobacteria bacterium]|nr:MAG: hypothetical protein DRQ89_06415 [Campylobacterota bacterium]RLA67779.1 MAG: hypothetical protein DRQ88_01640 [Campylobacterota bacterium]
MIDTQNTDKILEILETLSDEELSVNLLKEFSDKNKNFGKLLLNRDSNLTHDEWKKRCDEAQKDMDDFLAKIESYNF